VPRAVPPPTIRTFFPGAVRTREEVEDPVPSKSIRFGMSSFRGTNAPHPQRGSRSGEVDAGRRRQLDGALPEDPQPGDPLVEDHLGAVLHRLIGQLPDEIGGDDPAVARDVEDLLFR